MVAPFDAQRAARRLVEMAEKVDQRPVVDRATFLPIGQYEDGGLTFALPGFLKEAWDGAQRSYLDAARVPVPDAPTGTAWSGPLDAFNAASIAPMAGVAGRVSGAIPRGALGSGGSDMVSVRPATAERVTLYHGTTPDVAEKIREEGLVYGPAFFSSKDGASMYGPELIEVRVPKNELMIDFDLPGGRLLNVEDANAYAKRDGWTIDDYLRRGSAVGIERDVSRASGDSIFANPDASALPAIFGQVQQRDGSRPSLDRALRLHDQYMMGN